MSFDSRIYAKSVFPSTNLPFLFIGNFLMRFLISHWLNVDCGIVGLS